MDDVRLSGATESSSNDGQMCANSPDNSSVQPEPQENRSLDDMLRDELACIAQVSPLTAYLPITEMSSRRAVPIQLEPERHHLTVVTDRSQFDELNEYLESRTPGILTDIRQVPTQTINTLLEMITSTLQQPSNPVDIAFDADNNPSDEPEEEVVDEASYDSRTSKIVLPSFTDAQPDPELSPIAVVLFFTSKGSISPHVKSALASERIDAIAVKTAEEAQQQVQDRTLDCIYLEDSLHRREETLHEQLSRVFPDTAIRIYGSDRRLLTGHTSSPVQDRLTDSHLRLARYRNRSPRSVLPPHHADLAYLVTKVASVCGLSPDLAPSIKSAAYLHDLAGDDIKGVEAYERADVTRLSAGLLQKWQYPQDTVNLVRWMADGCPTEVDPESPVATAAALMRITDEFCHLCPDFRAASATDIRNLQTTLIERCEFLNRRDLIDLVLRAASERYAVDTEERASFRVHMLHLGSVDDSPITEALRQSVYQTEVSHNISECARAYRKLRPTMLLITCSDSANGLNDFLLELALKGVRIDQTPTIMLVESSQLGVASWCIKHGIEDLMSLDSSPEAIIAKIDRVRNRQQKEREDRLSTISQLGTHGSLADMNLTNLLEATRCGDRLLQVCLTGEGHSFTMYVQGDKIIFAESDTRSGIEAVSDTINWTTGVWSIDPIRPEDVPEPNINATIGSVLLEACFQNDQAQIKRNREE